MRQLLHWFLSGSMGTIAVVAALFAVVLCAPAFGAEFKAKVIATGQGHKETMQLYVKGQRYRLHNDSDPAKGDIVVDFQAGKVAVLDASSKQYHALSTHNPLDLQNSPDPFEGIERIGTVFNGVRKKTGTETVNGYLCDKYSFSVPGGPTPLAEYWVAQKLGFMLKLVYPPQWDAMNLEVREIQEGPVADSLVQIPAGYTLAEEHGVNAPPWLKGVASAPVVSVPDQRVLSAGQIIRLQLAAGQSVDIICKDANGANWTAVPFIDGKPTGEIPMNTWDMGQADSGTTLTRSFGSASGGPTEVVVRMNKGSATLVVQPAK